jgi:hypothetical protein
VVAGVPCANVSADRGGGQAGECCGWRPRSGGLHWMLERRRVVGNVKCRFWESLGVALLGMLS